MLIDLMSLVTLKLVQSTRVFSQVNSVEVGGYFGELGLINNKPRIASIVALGDVKVACKL